MLGTEAHHPAAVEQSGVSGAAVDNHSIALESPERGFGGTIDDAQQRPGGSLRRALALLPVAHGIDGDADAFGERDL
jgi:hypothetical protein